MVNLLEVEEDIRYLILESLRLSNAEVLCEGDIVYMGVFGNPIVVLNTKQAAYDLLDRKGSMYSSRPQRPMVTEL